MYEQKLKAQNPAHRNITYDIADLFFFIDSLGDLSCLGVPTDDCYRGADTAMADTCAVRVVRAQSSTISSARTSRTARNGSSSGYFRG
jgi:hypothetical protein